VFPIGVLMVTVFYCLGKTDFEDRVYWWTLSTVTILLLCLTALIPGE
jgi:hypothetical protein